MNKGSIYLSVEDLVQLTGGTGGHAYELHKTIREALTPDSQKQKKRNLTILEYCTWAGDDYRHIYFELRGKLPSYPAF